MALTRHIWAGFNKNWQKHKHLSIVFIQSHAVTQCHRTQHKHDDDKRRQRNTHAHALALTPARSNKRVKLLHIFSCLLHIFILLFACFLFLHCCRLFSVWRWFNRTERTHKQPKYWWAKWCTRNASKWQLHSIPPNTGRKRIRAGSIFNLMRTCLFVIHLPTVRYVQLEIVYYKWVDLPSVVSLTETISTWMKINAS